MESAKKILVIQTAFIGDVILATGILESLHAALPDSEIHFLLRKGNESLLDGHPFLSKVWVLDKKKKYADVARIIKAVRRERYDLVVNLQRFLTSGILTVMSGARETRGFRKNPMSTLFSSSFRHTIEPESGLHETERNHTLIADISRLPARPRLYPQDRHRRELASLDLSSPYICIAPASVWYTKQWPLEKWHEFLESIRDKLTVYILGAPGDRSFGESLISNSRNNAIKFVNLSGKISLLASAQLMSAAKMNYVNDSAPLHLASAINAPVTAIFCSTIPGFGFTPLSDNAAIVERAGSLYCRPCGLHGHRACPEGHFRCALEIDSRVLIKRLNDE